MQTPKEKEAAKEVKQAAEDAKQAEKVSADLQKRVEEEAASLEKPKPKPKLPLTTAEKAAALAKQMDQDDKMSADDIIEQRELPEKLKEAQEALAAAKAGVMPDDLQEEKNKNDIAILAAKEDLKS